MVSGSVVGVACILTSLIAAEASREVIQGNIYVTDSVGVGPDYTSNLSAGSTYIANFLYTAQPSNTTVGSSLGFCTILRDSGPSQCQYTLQLASGTVQVHFCVHSSVFARYLARLCVADQKWIT